MAKLESILRNMKITRMSPAKKRGLRVRKLLNCWSGSKSSWPQQKVNMVNMVLQRSATCRPKVPGSRQWFGLWRMLDKSKECVGGFYVCLPLGWLWDKDLSQDHSDLGEPKQPINQLGASWDSSVSQFDCVTLGWSVSGLKMTVTRIMAHQGNRWILDQIGSWRFER